MHGRWTKTAAVRISQVDIPIGIPLRPRTPVEPGRSCSHRQRMHRPCRAGPRAGVDAPGVSRRRGYVAARRDGRFSHYPREADPVVLARSLAADNCAALTALPAHRNPARRHRHCMTTTPSALRNPLYPARARHRCSAVPGPSWTISYPGVRAGMHHGRPPGRLDHPSTHLCRQVERELLVPLDGEGSLGAGGAAHDRLTPASTAGSRSVRASCTSARMAAIRSST